MADVWANSMACHPRATSHIAGWCHLAKSMSWCQSYLLHCRVCHRANSTAFHPRATYHIAGCCHLANSLSWFQSHMPCHIADCNNFIRHIENGFSPYFFILFSNAIWALTSDGFRLVSDTLVLLSRRSRQRERLGGLVHRSCPSVCTSVCLSVAKMQKTRFSQKLTNLELWCLLTTYRKLCKLNWAFQRTHYWIPTIQDGWYLFLKIDMPSFFSAEGGPVWIKFRRLVQNDMSTAVICGNGNQM